MSGPHRSRARFRALAAAACTAALGAALLGVAGTASAGAASNHPASRGPRSRRQRPGAAPAAGRDGGRGGHGGVLGRRSGAFNELGAVEPGELSALLGETLTGGH
ncbi:hypothetical protein [Streptomyces sp. NBC_01618]|uniref:hypothetical protein n=1 Tax=Streptomyces sp. NBC_01618 TaxID=2975900 RepID=UPI00386BB2DA|nr:hypothetical protein OH735_05600 [Streptomyces sp. NBC_01618]